MGYLSCDAESAVATCDPHYWDLKKRRNATRNRKPRTHKLAIREFHYSDLLHATKGFSADSFLGKGSHGSVYKATLDGGKLIAAVKTNKFSKPSNSGRNHTTTCTGCGNCTSPAENEIEILSRVPSPRRLVNLIGFCTDSNGNKLIVVEYMPNGSLYDVLHSTTRPPGWTRRVRFSLQVAKAVQALHSSNPPVIHRDIKSSNVLIDGDWNARLGDFGLALRGHVEDVRVKCTPPAGTLGYLDPCYLAPGDLSAKSDVFSFGIFLLEIISGRNAIDVNYSPPSVVDWAVPLIKRGEFVAICDRRIGTPSDPAVIRQLAVLAARCVRSTAEKRPSMAEVVECLKLVRKKVHASPIWSNLRRRVARVERAQPLMKWEAYDCDRSEEVVRAVKSGSRRNRKVSSVPGGELEREPSKHQMVRSKSIGSASATASKMKMHLDSNPNLGGQPLQLGFEYGRRKAKMGVMRLNKSRSMGVLQSPRLLQYGSENVTSSKRDLFQMAMTSLSGNNDPIHSANMVMSELVITDRKLEEKMLERPLVNTHHIGNQSD